MALFLWKASQTTRCIDLCEAGWKIFQCREKPEKQYLFLTQEKVTGNISFSDVQFAYPSRPDVQVLKGLSLQIQPGQKVALVGSSGCGKSTSIGLLERFYNPLDGAITVDQNEINTFNIKWWRSQLGLVSQEPVLFARSIKDNITYGLDRPVTDDEIESVAKKANIHSFVSSLPKVGKC